jgi:hypothetical protein
MSTSMSITIELPSEYHDWLQKVADRCNLSPGEVVQLQLVAQAHAASLGKNGTAALPRLADSASGKPSDDDTARKGEASVMDMLNDARDRLDRWEEKRKKLDGDNSRLEALRRRLDAVRGDAGAAGDFGPERSGTSSTTLIQQAMSRIQSIHADPSSASNPSSDKDDDEPTSMFELAD